MKQKKLLLIAAAGAIMTVMLSSPAMAAEQPSTDITVTDNPAWTTDSSGSPQGTLPVLGSRSSDQGTPYPTDIQLFEQGERNYLYKTYITMSRNMQTIYNVNIFQCIFFYHSQSTSYSFFCRLKYKANTSF